MSYNLNRGRKFVCPVCRSQQRDRPRGLETLTRKYLFPISHAKTNWEGWVKPGSLGFTGGDYAKLIHWNFLEIEHVDGARCVRITEAGQKFLAGENVGYERALIRKPNILLSWLGKEVKVTDLFRADELKALRKGS
jgi:hypothetical protein